jgi:peptide chain release factor 3
MLIDAGKGLEPQTRKLFEVCRMNGLPISFMNKMDRPALAPLELLDQIEKEFGLQTYPVNWPIGSGDRFRGVFHRPTREMHLFTKVASGSREAAVQVLPLDDPAVEATLGAELHAQLLEELELLEALGGEFDLGAAWAGQLTPVFFGSAANNFGVQLLLDTFLSYAAKPRVMALSYAASLSSRPHRDPHFTGFRVQAASQHGPAAPRQSGFRARGQRRVPARHEGAAGGMESDPAATLAQKMLGQEREIADFAYAGDIIGLNN